MSQELKVNEYGIKSAFELDGKDSEDQVNGI